MAMRGSLRCLRAAALRSTSGRRGLSAAVASSLSNAHPVDAPVPAAVRASSTLQSAVPSPSPWALKELVTSSDSSFAAASDAFQQLQDQRIWLREKHYLSLIYKASREGKCDDVLRVFDAFCAAEKQDQVLLPPRADRTWNFQSLERQQMHRFVLWALLDSRADRRMRRFYKQFVLGQPNRLGVFESDPLNFLLRMECTGKFAAEEEAGLRRRVEKVLATMETWKFNASYSSSHALFRVMLYQPATFVQEEQGHHQDDQENDPASVIGIQKPDAAAVVERLFVKYLNRYPTALRRDSKRLSIAVSAAATSGHHEIAKEVIVDAAQHGIRLDSISFAHAVECAPDDDKRMEIVDLYVAAKARKGLYTTQDESTSITNYLLLYAVLDGNFKHIMELLHEMQMYNNTASNKTIDELFQSIAQYRVSIRMESPDGESPADLKRKLDECPTIHELFKRFPNVLPRTVHTVSLGILQCLRGGDLNVALPLMRTTVWSTDITLRAEIYAQVLYALLVDAVAVDTQVDELQLVEVERLFETQHRGKQAHLNAQLLNICESNGDLRTMLISMDRWQSQGRMTLSRRSLLRVFDAVSAQLRLAAAQEQKAAEQKEADDATAAESVDEGGVQLSYRAVLERYNAIIVWDAWTMGNAIIRSGTNGLLKDVPMLLNMAHERSFAMEKAAYKIALESLAAMNSTQEIIACGEAMQSNGSWDDVVRHHPHLADIVTDAQARKAET